MDSQPAIAAADSPIASVLTDGPLAARCPSVALSSGMSPHSSLLRLVSDVRPPSLTEELEYFPYKLCTDDEQAKSDESKSNAHYHGHGHQKLKWIG